MESINRMICCSLLLRPLLSMWLIFAGSLSMALAGSASSAEPNTGSIVNQSVANQSVANQSVAGFNHQYPAYTRLLKAHVHEGSVDYQALAAAPEALTAVLAGFAEVSSTQFKGWTQAQQVAYLINLYNAATLALIVKHYPVDSIKDIGGWFRKPWSINFVQLFGRSVDLDHIEHDLLRPNYSEPRIHFALVCAAISCPPLRDEAYQAQHLEAQFEAQGKRFFAQAEKNNVAVAKGQVNVSPIFDWFKADFGDSREQVMAFVLPYFSAQERAKVDPARFVLRYTDYDWSLNQAKP